MYTHTPTVFFSKTGWERIDLAVISYVYYHYMSNDHCARWLAQRLNDGDIGAVLIISRFEDLTPQITAVARAGVTAVPLMTQPSYSRRKCDHRQTLYFGANAPLPVPLERASQQPMAFPNVPHEDGKDARDRSYGPDAAFQGLPPPPVPPSVAPPPPVAPGSVPPPPPPPRPALPASECSASAPATEPTLEAQETSAQETSAQQTSAPNTEALPAAEFAPPGAYVPSPPTRAEPSCAPSGHAEPPPESTAAAASTASTPRIPEQIPDVIPEQLRAAVGALSPEQQRLVHSFFELGGGSGEARKEELLLREERVEELQVCDYLVLDFEHAKWKRIRRKRKRAIEQSDAGAQQAEGPCGTASNS